jgi:hypothetical protein
MLPYKLRAPAYGSVEKNKLRKTDGTDETVMTGGGPMPKAIALDLKAFHTTFVTHIKGLQERDGTTWSSGKAFRVFKQLFGAGKIGLLHWLLPHIKCDQEAYAQIIYAACFECLHDSADLLEKCTAIMMLYTLYEINPLVRTGDLKPEELIPVGLSWREYPRAMFRRAFRQRIRIDRAHFIQLLRLREECCICIDMHQGGDKHNPITGVAGDTMVILERLASHWDFCEYTGPVGLEALAGHPSYPYRDYQEEATQSSDQAHLSPQGASSAVAAGETVNSQAALTSVLKEYQSAIKSIHFGSARTNLVSQLRETLHPVLPQEGKPSWLGRIETAYDNKTLVLGNIASGQEEVRPTKNQDESGDAPVSRVLVNTVQENQLDVTRRLVVPDEISEKSQQLLQSALEELLQRLGSSFIDKEDSGQVETRQSMTNDLSTLGGAGAATVASGHGQAAIEHLLAEAHSSARVPTSVLAPSTRSRLYEPPPNSMNRFLYADLSFDSENDDSASSDMSKISIDSGLDEESDGDDEVSAATSAIGQRALTMLLSRVSKTKASRPVKRKPTPRKQSTSLQDETSAASSVGFGQAALGSLLQQVESKKTRTRNRLAAKSEGYMKERRNSSSARRQLSSQDEQSTTSSVGVGQAALGSLLKQVGSESRKTKTRNGQASKSDGHLKDEGKSSTSKSQLVPAQDEQSTESSVGVGQTAIGSLLRQVELGKTKISKRLGARSDANRKRARSNDQGMPPPPPRYAPTREIDPSEQSTTSSVGAGDAALDALLKLAEQKPVGRK